MSQKSPPREIRLKASDLPFACPPPNATNWSMHPRVFIPLSAKQPQCSCPYCGTLYRLLSEEEKNAG